MAFHFPLMPRIFLAVRHGDRRPITDIYRHTPDIPPGCQWCLFLRNHDELTLEMVSGDERQELYWAYGHDPRMRLNLGIRRRLAPLLDNDRRKIEVLTSLLFTLPGSPILYYGDEIGMGDNIYLGDRNGVRTPMQWSGDKNAGFSGADPARLYLPLIIDPVYGYGAINVEAQERPPWSLLNWMRRLIATRKKTRAFGRGTLTFLRARNESVLAHLRVWEGETVLAVHNLSGAAQPVEIDLARPRGLDARRDAERQPVPRHRDRALLPEPGALRLLLVPAPAARLRTGPLWHRGHLPLSGCRLSSRSWGERERPRWAPSWPASGGTRRAGGGRRASPSSTAPPSTRPPPTGRPSRSPCWSWWRPTPTATTSP